MSIRPVDFQLLVPKVNEIGKNQSAEQQKLTNQVLAQAERSVKTAEQQTKSVHSQKEAQKTVIQEKQREQKKNKGQDKQRDKDNPEKENLKQKGTLPQERHTIDIRL